MSTTRVVRWLVMTAVLAGAAWLGVGDAPVEAQTGCEVNAIAVDCDAPNVVGPHEPFCAYTHWHGDLNGEPDPNHGGCGHGPVTQSGQPLIKTFESPIDLFIDLGFSFDQARALVEGGAVPPPSPSVFRFADDPNGSPTIAPPFGQIDGVSAGFISIPSTFPGGPPCDNVADPLLGTPGDDRLLVLCDGGDTLVGGRDYIAVSGTLGGPLPPADPLFQNYSFPLSFPGQPTWQHIPQYPGDTWDGASLIPYVTQEPGGTGFFRFATSVVQPDGTLADMSTGSVLVGGGNQLTVFVPINNFPGLKPDNVDSVGFGFAVHIHDGSYGSCADCRSSVSAFPPVPRDGLFTRPADTWPIINIVEVTPTATAASSTSGGGSQPGTTTTDGGSAIGESLDDSGSSATTLILGGVVVTVVIVGGGYVYTRQRRPALAGGGPTTVIGAPPGVQGPDGGLVQGGGLAGGGLGDGGLAPPDGNGPGSAPATDGPPTSAFLGEVEIDPELAAGLAKSFPDPESPIAPPPPPEVVTNRERADWETSLIRETEAQDRLQAEFKRLLDQVNAAWADYRSAVDRYRSRYTRMLSGSTEMQGLLATWAEVRGIAHKQDLAFAIVTLLWSGGSLALKGARWLRGGRAAAQTGEAATEAATAGAAVAEYSSEAPNFWKLFDMLNAKKIAGTERLATEAGLDFAELMAAHGDDIDAVLPIVLEGAAKARGWVSMAPEAENLISRLLVNGRGALGGRMATLAAEDVATLQRWAQQPGFWERLGKAAGMMDEVGWLGSQADVHQYISLLYSADDIAFLRKVAESGGDLSKLRQMLGPAQATALESLNGTLSGVVANAPTFLAPGAAHTAAYNAWQSDPVSQLGDVANFTDQFGITGELKDLDKAIDEGQILGTAWEGAKVYGGELWDLVSSPFETYQEYKFTFEALDTYEQFMANHGEDLEEMSHALDDAYRALERLNGTLDRAGLSADNGPLHRRMQDLRDVLNRMQEQFDNADQQWLDEFGDQYRERKAHIEEKLRYMAGVEGHLEVVGEHLPQMMDWLNSLRRPGGERRSLTSFIDPEIGVRMISAQTYLDQTLAAAYRNPTAGPTATAPAPEATPGAADEADDAFDDLFAEGIPLDVEYDDDELERQFDEQMRQLEAQWDEYDSLPEDYDLGVDLDFGTPPPGND